MPQGLLNILQSGQNLAQLNETKKVKATETGIVRGSLIVDDGGQWRRTAAADAGAADSPGPICFWSLQDQVQPDVDMADGLTGIPCTYNMLLETDQISSGGTFPLGGYVAAGDDGKLADHADGQTAVGVVKKSVTTRWSNDRLADATKGGANRTGAPTDVIQIWTDYMPNLSTAP
jgi:hypothetical protein